MANSCSSSNPGATRTLSHDFNTHAPGIRAVGGGAARRRCVARLPSGGVHGVPRDREREGRGGGGLTSHVTKMDDGICSSPLFVPHIPASLSLSFQKPPRASLSLLLPPYPHTTQSKRLVSFFRTPALTFSPLFFSSVMISFLAPLPSLSCARLLIDDLSPHHPLCTEPRAFP